MTLYGGLETKINPMDLQRLEELYAAATADHTCDKTTKCMLCDAKYEILDEFPTILKQLRAGETLARAVSKISSDPYDVDIGELYEQRDAIIADYEKAIK